MNQSHYDTTQILHLLTDATKYYKVIWCRIAEYMFFNGRNKALLNYVALLSGKNHPVNIDDAPLIDATKSYYCEYKGAAFCLMHFTQVLVEGQPAEYFYYLMAQRTPYDNFGYYSSPNDSDNPFFKELVKTIELQLCAYSAGIYHFYSVLDQLQDEVINFNPLTDTLLAPDKMAPPHKHCSVIDENNKYVEYVLVYLETNQNGEIHENIQGYSLKHGERLIDATPPTDKCEARWNGDIWCGN